MPWQILAQNNIGVWPETIKSHKKISLKEIQTKLQQIGYKIKITGKLDKQTIQVIKAFQIHFRTTKIDGNPDKETINILNSFLT